MIPFFFSLHGCLLVPSLYNAKLKKRVDMFGFHLLSKHFVLRYLISLLCGCLLQTNHFINLYQLFLELQNISHNFLAYRDLLLQCRNAIKYFKFHNNYLHCYNFSNLIGI